MSEKFLTISIISIKYANEEVEKTKQGLLSLRGEIFLAPTGAQGEAMSSMGPSGTILN